LEHGTRIPLLLSNENCKPRDSNAAPADTGASVAIKSGMAVCANCEAHPEVVVSAGATALRQINCVVGSFGHNDFACCSGLRLRSPLSSLSAKATTARVK
jgi:hypothetical protein